MDIYKNARLTLVMRAELVKVVLEQGFTLKTAGKWVRCFREEGQAGLQDRSSRPRSSPRQTPAERVEQVLGLRRLRYQVHRIATALQLSPATVSRLLQRNGLNRCSA